MEITFEDGRKSTLTHRHRDPRPSAGAAAAARGVAA